MGNCFDSFPPISAGSLLLVAVVVLVQTTGSKPLGDVRHCDHLKTQQNYQKLHFLLAKYKESVVRKDKKNL
jgi:hypothetical protein